MRAAMCRARRMLGAHQDSGRAHLELVRVDRVGSHKDPARARLESGSRAGMTECESNKPTQRLGASTPGVRQGRNHSLFLIIKLPFPFEEDFVFYYEPLYLLVALAFAFCCLFDKSYQLASTRKLHRSPIHRVVCARSRSIL